MGDQDVTDDVRQLIAQGPLTACQLAALAVCIGLNMLDGFDALAMALAAGVLTGAAPGSART
jgi:hypothetical protein